MGCANLTFFIFEASSRLNWHRISLANAILKNRMLTWKALSFRTVPLSRCQSMYLLMSVKVNDFIILIGSWGAPSDMKAQNLAYTSVSVVRPLALCKEPLLDLGLGDLLRPPPHLTIHGLRGGFFDEESRSVVFFALEKRFVVGGTVGRRLHLPGIHDDRGDCRIGLRDGESMAQARSCGGDGCVFIFASTRPRRNGRSSFSFQAWGIPATRRGMGGTPKDRFPVPAASRQ